MVLVAAKKVGCEEVARLIRVARSHVTA